MEKKYEISFIALISLCLRRWKVILFAMILFGFMAGGYQLRSQLQLRKDYINSEATREAEYLAALDEYSDSLNELEKKLASQEKSMKSLQDYMDNTLLTNIDPYDESITSIYFSLDVPISALEMTFGDDNPKEYVSSMICSRYLALWSSADLTKELRLAEYMGLNEKYLREVVKLKDASGGWMLIEAIGATDEQSRALANAAYALIQEKTEAVEAGSFEHEISMITNSTKKIIDESLDKNLMTKEENLETYMSDIHDINAEINELTMPERENTYSKKKAIIKIGAFGVIGCVAGLMCAAFIIIVLSLMKGTILLESEVEDYLNIQSLGSIPQAKWFSRIIAKMTHERGWDNTEAAIDYLRNQLKYSGLKEELLLLSSTTIKGNGLAAIKQLESENGKVVCIENANLNSEVLDKMAGMNSIVLVEVAARSSFKDVLTLKNMVERNGKEVSGFIWLN